ncbi:MAG TPA: thiolase family protein, partial [Planctomycetota bacterium]|nr:thiolase family protein [Planctomycetota bacterium]
MFNVDRRREPVIAGYLRTPFGRADAKKGFLRRWRSDDLAIHLLQELVKRTNIQPKEVDEVILGSVELIGEQSHSGRNVTFLADFPYEVTGLTVERACVTPMSAIHIAAMSVMCNMGDVYVAGGLDSMTHLGIPVMRADMDMSEIISQPGTLMSSQDPNPKLFEKLNPMELTGGVAAEKMVREYGLTRDEMDRWAHQSNVRAVRAHEQGRLREEILPLEGHLPDGTAFTLDRDQGPRPDSSLEKISTLPTVFQPEGGTINAASSAGQADGAAMVVVMAREVAERRGLKPLATIRGMAVAGCDPTNLVYSSVPASKKVLQRTGWRTSDVDLVECNEAFACAPIILMKELGLADAERVNVNGGACAIGHPVGATGARLVGHLALELKRQGKRRGLATICGGYG